MAHVVGKNRRQSVEQSFQSNYPEVQYCFVQFISEHISDCSREFDGDLQQMCILAVIGQVFLVAYKRSNGAVPTPAPAISASRLADVCGIPRETVRRKLKLLEKKGWIQRGDGDHVWTLRWEDDGSRARKDLRDLDRRGQDRLVRAYVELERIVTKPVMPEASIEIVETKSFRPAGSGKPARTVSPGARNDLPEAS